MDFTVSYRPSPDEVARALSHGVFRQLRTFRIVLMAVLAAGGVICLLAGAMSMGIARFAGVVVVPLVLPWAVRRAARSQGAYLCVPTTLHVTDDGYECLAEQYNLSLRWSVLDRIETTPEFWLFFTGGRLTAFLPRRAFDAAQGAALDARLAAGSVRH
ncbi:MAG: hypothetical protein GEV11_29910 [Streptosporangiales bacterium]|nr:hypothetical protein [Streptosporangiales bacterium]